MNKLNKLLNTFRLWPMGESRECDMYRISIRSIRVKFKLHYKTKYSSKLKIFKNQHDY